LNRDEPERKTSQNEDRNAKDKVTSGTPAAHSPFLDRKLRKFSLYRLRWVDRQFENLKVGAISNSPLSGLKKNKWADKDESFAATDTHNDWDD
jgi:hypothetical protein